MYFLGVRGLTTLSYIVYEYTPSGCTDLSSIYVLYILTPWSRVLLVKLTGLQLVKKFPAFMEPEGSLPHSQVPATCPYPKPACSSPYPQNPTS
jgi:hypothetical protein